MSQRPVYLALMHVSVVNRQGMGVVTAVTNLDIHDIARSAKTYGLQQYFIVTPVEEQLQLVERIRSHWQTEAIQQSHPDRYEALGLVRLAKSFLEVKQSILQDHGQEPEVVMTTARFLNTSNLFVSYADYARECRQGISDRPILLVFGTGWGLSEEFFKEVNRILPPICGMGSSYRHLSVRAAVAVVLDRLLGERE